MRTPGLREGVGAGGEGDGEMGVRVDKRASGVCREGLILISASDVTLSPASYELMDSVRTDRKPIPLSALQGPSGKLPSLVPYGSGTMRAQRTELVQPWSTRARSPIWQGWGWAPRCLERRPCLPGPGEKVLGTLEGSILEGENHRQCPAGEKEMQLGTCI